MPCTGTQNCYTPSGKYGVLSTSDSAFDPAYKAAPGWNFSTGIGTVNAYNLVMAFGSSGATPLPSHTYCDSYGYRDRRNSHCDTDSYGDTDT